ncbi:NADPH:quinone oxidoreductase family protein [Streptomyces sp. NBC_01320]|uniref:NADPH:quinone oxidoreductase family protein n=1 Tax=Streptomyces sp. NBC_01320 TaxID=2903824 RepID=UPI002E0F3E8F|nr:NADPH:quinone oxidoreductase family protein [Streptomyces sp. NBC_01320]
MRAVVARGWEPSEFSTEVVDERAPRPGEVAVSITLAGVSFGDALIATGRYQIVPKPPFIPGSEGIGVVTSVGPGVTEVTPGDKVMFYGFVPGPLRRRCTIGTFAERAVVPCTNLIRQPEGMSDAAAVLFRTSFETAFYALTLGRLKPGETALVLGAGGAIGSAAVQLAKALGGTVIALASTESKLSTALDNGADHAVDSRSPEWRQEVEAVDRGVDLIVDPVGGDVTERALRTLRFGGRHLVVGFAAGPVPRIPANLLIMKAATLVGVNLLRFNEEFPDQARAMVTDLLVHVEQGRVSPPTDYEEFGLDDVAEVLTRAGDRATPTRLVINPAPSRHVPRPGPGAP